MSNVLVQFRVKPDLKQEAEAIFQSMGMELNDAVRMFLQQTINVGKLPFQPTPKRPNAETLNAMLEQDNSSRIRSGFL